MRIRKGFTIIEVMFAITMLSFFIYFIATSMASTKKQHLMGSEYLTKAYIADVAVKLLRERIEVNPNFLANINNIIIKKGQYEKGSSYLMNPFFKDISYKDQISSPDYNVETIDIPVISYADADKKEGFYFGFVEFKPGNNIFAGDEKSLKTFLNVDELEKYSYDLKIDNDSDAKPAGVVKNIEVAVRFNGRKEPDQHPFKLVTKIICPASSMSSATYQEIQKNLFKDISKDTYEFIRNEMEKSGFTVAKLVTDIENECKKSAYSAMKIMDLSKPESAPDRPRAEAAIKELLELHSALELYNKAMSDLKAESDGLAGKTDITSLVKVMDNCVQKAQWALQVLEAINDPIDNILKALQPSGIAPPNPDAMFNYQVPMVAMRYLLSESENDKNMDRVSRFLSIGEHLPGDYIESLQEAFTRVNKLLNENYKKLTARQLQKYSKDMIAFYQMVNINSAKLTVEGYKMTNEESSKQASNTIELLSRFYAGNNYQAGLDFLECERYKMQQIGNLVATKFAEIVRKIDSFNFLVAKLKAMKANAKSADAVAKGQQEVALASTYYTINLDELSRIYRERGRDAVERYLARKQEEYDDDWWRRRDD